MGSGFSQEDYDQLSLQFYETALQSTCILPDVSIDDSLLKYSGTNSNTALQAYSNDLVNSVPGFIEKLGAGLGALTVVPNAVGLGALVISMIMEICTKSSTPTSDDSYSLLRRVFGEEKALGVRDTMSEYLKRHRLFIANDQRLVEELQRLEKQLSNQLTVLKNSLLYDGQMRSRGFKIWVNGASFHLQMMIHEARLNVKAGKQISDNVNSIKNGIDLYLQDFDNLLKGYKTYKTSTIVVYWFQCYTPDCAMVLSPQCVLANSESPRTCEISNDRKRGCSSTDIVKGFINNVFSKYEPITSLRNHFSDMKNNINTLINQHDSFTRPITT